MRRVVLVLAVMLPLVSCDPLLGPARLGLSLTQEGDTLVLYAPCRGELIARIAIAIVRDNLGGPDDEVLWEITVVDPDAVGELLEAIPGGRVPNGFDLTVKLDAPLPPSRVLTAAVFPKKGSANAHSFKLSQLHTETILTDIDTQVSRSEFLSLAGDTCDNRLDA
jgi:hypothetical protein